MFQKINDLNTVNNLGNTSLSNCGNYENFINKTAGLLRGLPGKERNEFKKAEQYLDSNSLKDRIKGANMIAGMMQQKKMISNGILDKNATIVSNLGTLPRISAGVVGIFYDETVGQYLVQNQFIDQPYSAVFVKRPVYTNTAGGVTAGQDMFGANLTDGTYASASQIKSVPGTETAVTINFPKFPLRPGTLEIRVDGKKVSAFDRGSVGDTTSTISGPAVSAGTINYSTGAVTFTLVKAPVNKVEAEVVYYYDDTNATIPTPDVRIREGELKLDVIPITAKAHPIKFKYSQEAFLQANASLNMNIEDDLRQMSISELLIEKDQNIIRAIYQQAIASEDLDYNISLTQANGVAGVFRQDLYKGFETMVETADTLIRTNNFRRGGVSYVIVSNVGKKVVTQCPSFKADPNARQPHVGPFRIGTLMDGTIDVIYVPVVADDPNRLMNEDDYLVGFQGFVWGDSSIIVGTFVDMFNTQLFQTPDFYVSQGYMSLYDIVKNSTKYIVKGKFITE